jgi:exonuclease III
VNGFRLKEKRLKVWNFLRRGQFDVVFLQETHNNKNDVLMYEKWQREWQGGKGKCFWSFCESSHARGVGILVSDRAPVDVLSECNDNDGRYISLKVKLHDSPHELTLVNTHMPPFHRPVRKLAFLLVARLRVNLFCGEEILIYVLTPV